MKYKIQTVVSISFVLLFAYVLVFFPSSSAINYFDLPVEGGMTLCCLYLMFKIESLKDASEVYWILLVASCLLFMGNFLDFIDELTITLNILDFLEDIFKPVGFVLLLLASFRWVKFHNEQSQLLTHLAETDHLTGIFNRRAFADKVEVLMRSTCQDNTEVSIIIFDIDHFKIINDTYGHQMGDQMLIEISKAIRPVIRKGDCFARQGGEEFIVLLKDTSSYEAAFVAEKIRCCVENIRINHNQDELICTVSLGLATVPTKELVLEQLIARADKALYAAKAKGRNCLQVA